MTRNTKTIAFLIVAISSFGLHATNVGYRITFSNESAKAYFIFSGHSSGANPIVLTKGEKTKPVFLGETKHLYIGTPQGVKKLISQQVYPVPAVVITEELEGFNTSTALIQDGRDILVVFEADETIKLINLSKKK
jgi:hypothetical protein